MTDVSVSTSAIIGDLCALFIEKALLSLSNLGSQALDDVIGKRVEYCEQPVILAGDFNVLVNFSLPAAAPLLQFLKDKLSLEMINGKNQG